MEENKSIDPKVGRGKHSVLAGLRVNEGPVSPTQKPASVVNLSMLLRLKRLQLIIKGKPRIKQNRRKRSDYSLQSRLDYFCYDNEGPNAIEDIPTSNLHELMVSYYNTNVEVTEAAAQKITINTVNQGDGEDEEIGKQKQSTKVNSTIIKLLYSKFRGNKATDCELLQEYVSRLRLQRLSHQIFLFQNQD